MPTSDIYREIYAEHLDPLLRAFEQQYIDAMHRNYKTGAVPEKTKQKISSWVKNTVNDMSSTKLAALRYGEQMRDSSMLNYNKQYNFDAYLNMIIPYQFWYTRSQGTWNLRMLDRPALYALYARYRNMQEKMERKGMPTRLRGRVRFPMPFLGDGMGGAVWIDPWKQLFPPDQFARPYQQFLMDNNQIVRRTEQILQDQMEAGRLTPSQFEDAKRTQAGDAWEIANTQAKRELDKSDSAMSLVGQMIQPALWYTYLKNYANKTPEKNTVLPMTRTGQSLRTVLKDTPLESIGNIAGSLLAGPEEAIRQRVGLSKYGEQGDYYIDAQLAWMAGDGIITADESRKAMIERKGPIWDMAVDRAEKTLAIRTPGILPIMALKEGASPVEVSAAIWASLFPAGLLPSGELKMRNLKVEFDKAWQSYNAGNDKAINKFFEDHPEYEARLALYDEPEERLRQFLVSQIWDKYTALERMNKTKVRQSLGPEFEQVFLESKSYDTTDVNTLARWSQLLGSSLPDLQQFQDIRQEEPIDLYKPETMDAVTAWNQARDDQFPMIKAIQTQYYALPPGAQRKQYLREHPQLKKYWDWNTEYKNTHPELKPFLDNASNDQLNEDLNDISMPLMRQMMSYYLTNKPLSGGAKAELTRIWIANGKKGDDLDAYIREMVQALFGESGN